MSINIDAVQAALAKVNDPEIHRPITELGMVDHVEVTGQTVNVKILLTISRCPMQKRISVEVKEAVNAVPGVAEVNVELGVMSDAQRLELRKKLGGQVRDIPFTLPSSTTRVLAVSSGKGGVGKSTTTANLALALAAQGKSVGILDADIYGHSIPGIFGVPDAKPTVVDGMIMPVPAMGLKIMSMGMFKENRRDVVAWRGPILDKALTQMLTDVVWGELDYLLLDLPPGTGDIAMSLGQKLPNAEYLVVTTPQPAASEVAERAGTMAAYMKSKVIGVIENMSYLDFVAPDTGKHYRIDVFGSGGGVATAAGIGERCGYPVPVLAQIPLEPALRQFGDAGTPIVVADPESAAAAAFLQLAQRLVAQKRPIVGKSLGLQPE